MSTRKRKIVFVSERRADYSRLKPIMREVQKSKHLEMFLVVTGVHLLKYFGETRKVLKNDGFRIDAVLPIFTAGDRDDGASMVRAMGRALMGFADIFTALKPDIIFAGFDLGANLAAAIAGMHLNIHVSHIQGGEVSGTIDEVLRHALTKFSHIHFAATEQSRRRIIRLGEDPRYVFHVGSPSLDTIRSHTYLPRQDIFQKYARDPSKPLILFLQHPVTTEVDETVGQISESIAALKAVQQRDGAQVLAVYSNNDAGGMRIIRALRQSGMRVLPHIVYEDFLNLMKYADVLVGNSSSGIHEAPSFGLPTVNIGSRQQHRERGVNVLDVPHQRHKIARAIEKSLYDRTFIARVKKGKNPYEKKGTAKAVVRILERLILPPIQKVITY